MTDSMNDFVERLQKQIFEETRKAYGDEVFSRWQGPKFMGKMTAPTCSAIIRGTCGDTMEIYLQIKDDRVQEARFFTDGCGASVACGSVAAELAAGKDIEDAALIDADEILEVLGGLPEEERHCADLAAEALQAAIHEWMGQRSGHYHEAGNKAQS